MKNQKTEKRPIDILIDEYAGFHQKPANQYINYICIPLILFSILGFIWSIPFPHLGFLGSYNGYFNWASFLIAFAIYYYMKRSPVLSYIMLIMIFAFTYIIIQLQAWQKAGGFILPQMCVVVFVMANIAQLIGYRIEGKKPTFMENFKFLLIEPIWLLSLGLKRFKIKY
jgi:uncharacterized membrane protein YGL010W